MKKLIFAAAVVAAGAFCANAEDYNRIGVSYNNTHFGFNSAAGDSDDNFSTNGFGIGYTHGFSLSSSCPIFLETGLNLNFGFDSSSEENKMEQGGYWMSSKVTSKKQFMDLQIPVNFVYSFHATENFSISPYVGLNFKVNVLGRYRNDVDVDSNLPSNVLDKDNLNGSSDWLSVFSKDDMDGGDNTWNRFQMGWQVGVGFQYKPVYLGVQYGTDFIPAFKYKEAKVNTGTFRLDRKSVV